MNELAIKICNLYVLHKDPGGIAWALDPDFYSEDDRNFVSQEVDKKMEDIEYVECCLEEVTDCDQDSYSEDEIMDIYDEVLDFCFDSSLEDLAERNAKICSAMAEDEGYYL